MFKESNEKRSVKIGFVFTNYKNSHYTRQAVHSLSLNNEWENTYVVIVDNDSGEEDVASLKTIKEDYPSIHLILGDENIGYFKGLNVGIRYLRERYAGLEHFVIGNNDLVFPPEFIHSVYANLGTIHKYAVISPDIVTLDGEHQNPHVLKGISKKRELVWDVYFSNYTLALIIKKIANITKKFTRRKDFKAHLTAQTIYSGYGACYILSPLFFKYFEQLWAPTFLMGEEFFLSRQLAEKNLQVYYEPAIRVNHHDHATVDKMPSKRLWELTRDYHKIYRQYVKVFR